jgi:adenylosuccinate synthase
MIPSTIIIGAQWGDEGKGKIVDYLTKTSDFVVRYNGGNNAGHTVVLKGVKYPLSQIPSGVLWGKKLLIAQGCVVNPKVLINEIETFKSQNHFSLTIDKRVNIVMPYHQWLDAATEMSKGDKKVGSLKLGIGYCYEDRNNRHGIRLEDLVRPAVFKEKLEEEFSLKEKRLMGVFGFKPDRTVTDIYKEFVAYGKILLKYMGDVSTVVSMNIKTKNILFEGAHGTFLDGNFGTYPYTTAVNTISGGVFPYVGFPPCKLNVVGVVKAYTTRVGGGPFPCELFDEIGARIQDVGHEFGTVSKRRRRCGWLDLPMLRVAHRLNGFTRLAITKLDVLTGIPKLKVATHYMIKNKKIMEFPSSLTDVAAAKPVYKICAGWSQDITGIRKYSDLPKNCRTYLEYLAKALDIPISYISVAPERSAMIVLK